MGYTTTAPASIDSVHPTLPGLRVPVQVTFAPDPVTFRWVIANSAPVPLTGSETAAINARIDALETSVEDGSAGPPPRFYSEISIANAEALGRNSFPLPEEGDAFYAVLRNSSGTALHTQLHMYTGVGASAGWQKLTDTYGATTPETAANILSLQNAVGDLQTSIGDRVEANVTVKYETAIPAPSEFAIPSTVAALNASSYTQGEVVRVMFSDAYCDYTSTGTAWVRVLIRYFGLSDELPPTWPHQSAKVQAFPVPGDEAVIYFGVLRPDGDINTSMLDRDNGRANWVWPGQIWGEWHHEAIMHMAEVGSQWHVHEYSGHPIGNGKIGGVFTFTDSAATGNQRRATPIGNNAFTERKA